MIKFPQKQGNSLQVAFFCITITLGAIIFTAFLDSNISDVSRASFKPQSSQTGSDPGFITCEPFDNKSIAWLKGSFRFNITTDTDITLYYSVYGLGEDNADLRNILRTKQLVPGSNIVSIPIELNPTTLPGVYTFDMTLSFYNSSSGLPIQQTIQHVTGDVTVSMGYMVLIMFTGILMTGLIVIVIREEKVRPKKEEDDTSGPVYIPDQEEEPPEQPSLENVPAGHIKCPECKEVIIEGSSFCPECGYHIPRFLRTRQG